MTHARDFTIILALAAFAAVQGCSGGDAPQYPPASSITRIVSLSPSITREIMDLGCGHKVVGVTTFSPVPGPWVSIVGPMIRPNTESIALLKPDIILASREDSAVQYTERLISLGIPVHEFARNHDFDALCDNYRFLAKLLGKEKEAELKLKGYREKRAAALCTDSTGGVKNTVRIAFFLSADPAITVSDRSFIGRIIADAGGINCYAGVDIAYPAVSLESLAERSPDIVFTMDADMLRLLKSGTALSAAVHRIHWYVIPPDNIAYFTPADYVNSVRFMRACIDNNGGGTP